MRVKVVFIIGLISICFLIIVMSVNWSITSKNSEVTFGKWDAVYIGHFGENYLFNFIVLEKKGDKSILDDIEKISFRDSKLLEVTEYQINKGDKIKDRQLLNMVISTKAINNGEETIKDLIIHSKKGKNTHFPIGHLNVKIDALDNSKNAIIPSKDYTVSYPKSDMYRATLKNTTQETIIVEKIKISNQSIHFKDITINGRPLEQPIHVNPQEEFIVQSRIEDKNGSFQFHLVSPEITYKTRNKREMTYLPGTLYGIMNITDETIQSILSINHDILILSNCFFLTNFQNSIHCKL